MQVNVMFVCSEVVGPLRSGIYEIPEDSALSDLLDISASECPSQCQQTDYDLLVFLRNGRPAQLDSKLYPGDKIHVMLKIFGG